MAHSFTYEVLPMSVPSAAFNVWYGASSMPSALTDVSSRTTCTLMSRAVCAAASSWATVLSQKW